MSGMILEGQPEVFNPCTNYEACALHSPQSNRREQAGNGVGSVLYVVFEGKRRDFTLVGAKEVGEYVKTLEQVSKECS